jgi:hypothetical protein
MSREDEMRKGSQVILDHLSHVPYEEQQHNYSHGQPTLTGRPRESKPPAKDEAERLKRLALVRMWEAERRITLLPAYSIGHKKPNEIWMQAVRCGGQFFEEPDSVFPSEYVFAQIALAVKAGIDEKEDVPLFSMRLP